MAGQPVREGAFQFLSGPLDRQMGRPEPVEVGGAAQTPELTIRCGMRTKPVSAYMGLSLRSSR